MGIKPEDIARAVAGGNKVLAQLGRVCPRPEELGYDLSQVPPKQRIRQRTKPLSNKLEAEFGDYLRGWYSRAMIYEQAITLRLANGLRYTPDWIVCRQLGTFCYEVKGRHAWDDALAKLKMAAGVYPMWGWFLVWKEGQSWELQSVLP